MYTDKNGDVWYKGNLHMHTSRSDGALSPEDACELYGSKEYDFIALTDHWKLSPADTYKNMLLLSGCEYNVGANPREGVYHILAIGCTGDPGIEHTDTPQAIVDKIHEKSGLAVIAHPAWSINTPEQIEAVRGFDATEIFNSVSDLPRNVRPYSGTIVDMLASKWASVKGRPDRTVPKKESQSAAMEQSRQNGYILPLLATDDAHWYGKNDACRSYIMVKAGELTREAILSAIRAEDFYATQGPRIEVIREGNSLRVTCESDVPCESIVFFSDSVWVGERCFLAHDITEAVYTIPPSDTFVRVEVCDALGRYAWSNIVRV